MLNIDCKYQFTYTNPAVANLMSNAIKSRLYENNLRTFSLMTNFDLIAKTVDFMKLFRKLTKMCEKTLV